MTTVTDGRFGYRYASPLQLLATAGHVALYDFDIPTKRWVCGF